MNALCLKLTAAPEATAVWCLQCRAGVNFCIARGSQRCCNPSKLIQDFVIICVGGWCLLGWFKRYGRWICKAFASKTYGGWGCGEGGIPGKNSAELWMMKGHETGLCTNWRQKYPNDVKYGEGLQVNCCRSHYSIYEARLITRNWYGKLKTCKILQHFIEMKKGSVFLFPVIIFFFLSFLLCL